MIKSPLRVLHVIDGLGPGGAETLLYRMVSAPSDIQHEVACLGSENWYSGSIRESRIPLYHLGSDSLEEVPAAIARLVRIIRRRRIDVVQGWLYRSNMVSGLAGRIASVPVVWGIHCASLEPLGVFARLSVYLSGALARWIPKYIITCSEASSGIHSKLGFSAVEGGVIHNGYDASAFFPDEGNRALSRKSLGISPGEFVVGSIARWNAYKDIPNLLRAVRIARDRGVPLRCLLIGRGLTAGNPELEIEIQNLRCGDIVLCLGERPDVQNLARVMDVHVLASRSEAFPNVVAETMLSGTPNAVTNVGDSSLMVGSTGWIAPPRDPKKLADAIVAAYHERKNEPEKWENRRRAARQHIAENFTLEGMAAAYKDVWTRISEGGRAARAARM